MAIVEVVDFVLVGVEPYHPSGKFQLWFMGSVMLFQASNKPIMFIMGNVMFLH